MENYTFDVEILAVFERGKFTPKEGATENAVAFIEFIKPIVKFIKDGEGKKSRGQGGGNPRQDYGTNEGFASRAFEKDGRGQAVEMRNSNEAPQEDRKDGAIVEDGKKAVYKLDVNGTKYTVVTYVKQNKEEFHNFYSNKKGQPSQSVNASIGDTQSARITEELASADKGNTSSAEMQEDGPVSAGALPETSTMRR